MNSTAYLKLKGQHLGDIRGSSTAKGQEGKIVVFAAEHEVNSPRDPATGLATGKRQHRPFVISKEVDASSPLLYKALATNETFSDWELQFWSTNAQGVQVQRYAVKLTTASISDIKFRMPNRKLTEMAALPDFEDVAFTYQKIQWTWTDGGITAQDDWSAST
jgi:type VI secretion system secreted protein Hcp